MTHPLNLVTLDEGNYASCEIAFGVIVNWQADSAIGNYLVNRIVVYRAIIWIRVDREVSWFSELPRRRIYRVEIGAVGKQNAVGGAESYFGEIWISAEISDLSVSKF